MNTTVNTIDLSCEYPLPCVHFVGVASSPVVLTLPCRSSAACVPSPDELEVLLHALTDNTTVTDLFIDDNSQLAADSASLVLSMLESHSWLSVRMHGEL